MPSLAFRGWCFGFAAERLDGCEGAHHGGCVGGSEHQDGVGAAADVRGGAGSRVADVDYGHVCPKARCAEQSEQPVGGSRGSAEPLVPAPLPRQPIESPPAQREQPR